MFVKAAKRKKLLLLILVVSNGSVVIEGPFLVRFRGVYFKAPEREVLKEGFPKDGRAFEEGRSLRGGAFEEGDFLTNASPGLFQ